MMSLSGVIGGDPTAVDVMDSMELERDVLVESAVIVDDDDEDLLVPGRGREAGWLDFGVSTSTAVCGRRIMGCSDMHVMLRFKDWRARKRRSARVNWVGGTSDMVVCEVVFFEVGL
jgi:hypothetical protein